VRAVDKNGADGLVRKPPVARNPPVKQFKNDILQVASRRNQLYLRIMFYTLLKTI